MTSTALRGSMCGLAGLAVLASGFVGPSPAAGAASLSVAVPAARVVQKITWTPTVTSVAGSATSFTPSPLATTTPAAAGAITYAVTGGTASCAVNRTTAVITWTRSGSCVVTATAARTAAYRAASTSVTFTITPAAQAPLVISNTVTTATAGTVITLTTTGGSGTGAVTFAVSGQGCSVAGSSLSANTPTTCTVVATKAASGSYGATSSTPVPFTFSGAAQSSLVISNASLSGFAGTPIGLTTSGGSGTGAVTFAVSGQGCSVAGPSLSANAPTACSVVATKAASGIYGAASSAPVLFTFLDAGVRVSDDLFGGHFAPQTIGQSPFTPALVRLWDLQVAWRDVNPAEGVYDWTALDARVAEVEALGARPLLVLGLTPLWAASSTAGDPRYGAGSAAPPTDMNAYSEYVAAVASRYRGRIAGYQVWNEANLQTFWTGTPEQMAELTQRAFDAIAAADQDALVIAASTTLRLPGRLTNFTKPYYAGLMARGWPIDAFSIHSYPSGVGTPVDRFALVRTWQALVTEVSGSTAEGLEKLVLDTEINYGLAGPGTTPGTDLDDATGAAYLARTYADSVRLGLHSTHWYLWTAGFFDVVGVQMNSATPAVNGAYSVVKSWLSGSGFRGCRVTGGVTECDYAKGGAAFTLAFADAVGTPYSGGQGTATFIDGTTAPGVAVTSLGLAPVRFA